MKNLPLYTIIFKDGSHFMGGTSYFETKWLEIPLKPIKRIFYKLPTNDYICLEGEYSISYATKEKLNVKKGVTILLPAVLKQITLNPKANTKIIEVYINQ